MSAIYFDLDGTLTDPKPGITRSIQYALRRMHCEVPSEDALIWCIGPPLRASLATLLSGEARADEALTFYRERFSEIGLFENSLYPGVTELLSALSARNIPLFVATSKPAVYAERIVAHFGLNNYFQKIYGSELDGTRADKADLLAHALTQTRSDPGRSIMIGDRSHDMAGARKNGMRGFGVLYGYGSEKELLDSGAEQIFKTPEALKAAIG